MKRSKPGWLKMPSEKNDALIKTGYYKNIPAAQSDGDIVLNREMQLFFFLIVRLDGFILHILADLIA